MQKIANNVAQKKKQDQEEELLKESEKDLLQDQVEGDNDKMKNESGEEEENVQDTTEMEQEEEEDKNAKMEQEKKISDALFMYNGVALEDLCLVFTLPGYDDFELVPGGSEIEVTLENLQEYIDSVIKFYLVDSILL